MRGKPFTYLLYFFSLAFMGTLASCQKDSDATENATLKASHSADSAAAVSSANILASGGTLSITINDSTYTFDASRDSIAFINVHDDNEDNSRYYGITAINKEHNMSFGISSSGYVHSDKNGDIAGSQFLLGPGYHVAGFQYSLSRYAGQKDFGNIHIEKYNQDSVLAKGTFHAWLSPSDKADAPVYKAEGTFNLRLK
ncbi:MAG TPA: hypothetical protein VHA56_19470 [Mucilaginibacter sp.]|nr:hypothetical protein [Mucilaginibacter sp.]